MIDIHHVLTYLRNAAHALYGGAMPDSCHGYVHNQLTALLEGRTQAVIDDLSRFSDTLGLNETQRKPVQDAVRYFTNNAPFMRYDVYLARGWPIATGAIEGGCKHVVRGRMTGSGMRWTRPGAQAMLHLRAVRINGDWDDYQRFHRHQEHLRLYASAPPTPCLEDQALALAA